MRAPSRWLRLRHSALPLAVATTLGVGCLNDVGSDGGVRTHAVDAAARGPLLGAGTGDSADRACQVILRDIGRVTAGDGHAVVDGRWVIEGRVDVARAAIAEGAAVRLLVGADGHWHDVEPAAATDLDAHHHRVLFHLDATTLPGAMPGPSNDVELRVIPYLTLGAARVFDHNTLVDATAAYVLDAANGYAVTTPAEICAGPVGPTLTFAADWSESQSGPIVAGRGVMVDYDIARNSACRQTYNGAPTWSVVAVATFLPMHVVQEVSVVDLTSGAPRHTLARLFAPDGATELVLYFRNSDRAGCVGYDSDFGRDYHHPILAASEVHAPDWIGNDVATISRAASSRCEGAVPFGGALSFDSWARQRATITDLCFEVWEPGVTDVDSPDLWRTFDVQVHHRFDPAQPFSTGPVSFAGRSGNNARYALDLRAFDPFQWGRCAGAVPTDRIPGPGGAVERATLELFFTVNGVSLRPASAEVYRIAYEDAADGPRTSCEAP